MKSNQLIIPLLLAGCLWQGCGTQPQQMTNTEMTLVIDRTDTISMTNYPTSKSILQPLDIHHHQWSGFKVTLTFISDKDVNDRVVIELPRQSEWKGNIVTRAAQIADFAKQVQHALDTMRNAPTCAHSIVYRTIAREANRLAGSPADKKYLLIWSNLYENNGDLNFYRPSFVRELKNTPEKIEQRMTKSLPLGSLSHIQIYVLYNPVSFADNNAFMPIAEIYRHLFEAHGAQVHVATQFALP